MLKGLLQSEGDAGTGTLLKVLDSQPMLGLAGPLAQLMTVDDPRWAGRSALAVRRALALTLGETSIALRAPYFAGTMFWYRPAALVALKALAAHAEDFEPELGQTDGTLAHGAERAIGAAVRQAGFEIATFDADGRGLNLASANTGTSPRQ